MELTPRSIVVAHARKGYPANGGIFYLCETYLGTVVDNWKIGM
jgi:hypothetical protein